MTNKQLRALKPYIKFKNVIQMIPGGINNWQEKLSGTPVRENEREFTERELMFIQSALLGIADTIIKNSK